ncbi:hypothetical protein FSP39_006132 [Pinctada imbricata]|uniref:guanylate cyclase n=1 Tax=Pinctada imbricata TaxID=66713 RepID=A0AA88XJP3_PINIB|nr:hypothetical protein FSP39_006132 [Pinctada imbricata]
MDWIKKKVDSRVRPSVVNDNYEDSNRNSVESMTASQLNMAVMEMLHSSGTGNKNCDAICRGNPITESGKRQQLLKMLSIVFIPVSVLLGMTANSFITTVDNYVQSKSIRNSIAYSTDIGKFLRFLQRERDMSALYVSIIGPETKSFLMRRYADTDNALDQLRTWNLQSRGKGSQFETKDRFLTYLNRHRYQLDTTVRTSRDEIQFYTGIIEVFLGWLYDEIKEARSGSIWKTVVAYQEIIVASEYIGRERAYGVIFYAYGGFRNRDEYILFMEAQDIANVTFTSCRRYSEIAFQTYDMEIAQQVELLNIINEMRFEIRSNNSKHLRGSLAKTNSWFENMTLYQDVVRTVQKKIADRLNNMLQEVERRDLTNIAVTSAVFVAIVIICPLILAAVYLLTSEIQKYSIKIAARTNALNKEKRRTNKLLYQMLPKSIAEKLKLNQTVEAEEFQEATIFFSDIVGFTKISSQSSPLQVVDMLNSLYLCFDDRISMYEVYKVETIGDAYMVVSGVPRQNGHRHAAEIGTMALDLLKKIKCLEIPHLPGTKFKLRIGCHSGRVVAGVVGSKMPRYCLFGETVSVASKMESLGKSNKVHISQVTHDILLKVGGFVMEERLEEVTKADPELSNAFKGDSKTYWLKKLAGRRGSGALSEASTGTSEKDDGGKEEDVSGGKGIMTEQ